MQSSPGSRDCSFPVQIWIGWPRLGLAKVDPFPRSGSVSCLYPRVELPLAPLFYQLCKDIPFPFQNRQGAHSLQLRGQCEILIPLGGSN